MLDDDWLVARVCSGHIEYCQRGVATNSIGAGCSIETLAELIGDTPKVAFDHYGREWGQHYQDPLWAAIGVGDRG